MGIDPVKNNRKAGPPALQQRILSRFLFTVKQAAHVRPGQKSKLGSTIGGRSYPDVSRKIVDLQKSKQLVVRPFTI